MPCEAPACPARQRAGLQQAPSDAGALFFIYFFAAALCAPCWEKQLHREGGSLGGFPRQEAHAFSITGKERRLLTVSIKNKLKKLRLLPLPSLLLLPTRLRFRTKDSSQPCSTHLLRPHRPRPAGLLSKKGERAGAGKAGSPC